MAGLRWPAGDGEKRGLKGQEEGSGMSVPTPVVRAESHPESPSGWVSVECGRLLSSPSST